eukprot:gnl/TRDRNA2_/TRDRNA2_147701_c0_seq1.p1 gnl/TRDRNA2_/TRDRNA2_147701_c0~~gnl/TRDRNA2_/TRDRNA2_147701_c0_seq1.p1  ORF type:complete len:329 (+),score=68.99 gnl/TRDRNA2_/TRDRNA2_147701_c0_seq1:89-1075(+)
MPNGLLAYVLHGGLQASSPGSDALHTAWLSSPATAAARCRHVDFFSLGTTRRSGATVFVAGMPMPGRARRGASILSAFEGEADADPAGGDVDNDEADVADQDAESAQEEQDAAPADASAAKTDALKAAAKAASKEVEDEGKKDVASPRWAFEEGLPTVTVSKPSEAFFSKDIADLPGESVFKPTLACKCGDWSPAPAHPEIDFKPDFLASHHGDFFPRLSKLKVHMEDTTKPGTVHWDATYDVRRFHATGSQRLADTDPAIPGSGSQPRFMTFCPPELGPPHVYQLKVTALDAGDRPIEYFNEQTMEIVAKPPEPQTEPHPAAAPATA